MDEETDEEELDSSDEVDPIEEQVEGDTVSRAQFEKVQREARSLRTKLRRSEFAKEYGDEVVELVPESLTLKEQKELAGKLQERFAATASTQDADGTATTPSPPVEVLSEAEKRMAAIVKPRETAAPSGKTWSWDEYRQGLADPSTRTEAMRARASGRVDESTYAP